MMRRALSLVFVCFACAVLSPRLVSAAIISLPAPLTGSDGAGALIDLTVSFDPNGSAATNLVGQELYLGFLGLHPVSGSYALGSEYAPFAGDLLSRNGLCSSIGCGVPADDPYSPQYYGSYVNVFTPFAPSGPGTLFTMQFAVAPGAGSWSLNLFGDDRTGLLWEPPRRTCDPNDHTCDPNPPPATIPYAIVLPTDFVPPGLARVNVSFTVESAPTVPEPGTEMLLGTGLFALAIGARRRHLKQPVSFEF